MTCATGRGNTRRNSSKRDRNAAGLVTVLFAGRDPHRTGSDLLSLFLLEFPARAT